MKIVFLIAHPDDEAYGPYGTIVKLVREGHDVHVFCLCDGRRPGAEDVAKARVDRFIQNCENAGAKWKIWSNPDLSLEIKETTEFVSELIAYERPDIVYTHNISDINRDHRIIAEAAMVACRPKPDSTVLELYYFEVPASTDWTFYKLQPVFQPNVYNELSPDIVKLKEGALSAYDTETYEFPDARSVKSMLLCLEYRGSQVGLAHTEAFQLVFSRNRKSQ